MELYPYVFHPAVMVGAGALVLIVREFARQDADRGPLRTRLSGFLGAGLLSFVPTLAYAAITGQGLFAVTQGNVWQVDALVAGGIFFTAGVTWLLWRHFDWGSLVPGYVEALALATVPYVALSPFWNVSGHVTMALAPTLYLTLVDGRFWPTLAIPVVMAPNRLYLDTHTWPQVVGAFVLTGAIVSSVYWIQTDGSFHAVPDSPVT